MGFIFRNTCPQCQHHVDPWQAPQGHIPSKNWVCRHCGARLHRVPCAPSLLRWLTVLSCVTLAVLALEEPLSLALSLGLVSAIWLAPNRGWALTEQEQARRHRGHRGAKQPDPWSMPS